VSRRRIERDARPELRQERPLVRLEQQAYADGVVRHNLGLDEAIYTVLIAALFFVLGRRPRPPGFFLGAFMILYAPFRFGADFLRIIDVRYCGLTPGQYGCVALLLAGAAILLVGRRSVATKRSRAWC
jgi:phosphatidylglycerol:prolipoprotein diacylglycerol transferase